MKLMPDHRAFTGKRARLAYSAVIGFRILFFTALVYVLDSLLKPGTSPLLLSAGATTGIIFSSSLSFTRLRTPGLFAVLAVLAAGYLVSGNLLQEFESSGDHIFRGYLVSSHLNLFSLAFLVTAVATWLFWRFRFILTLEAFLCTSVIIYLLSAHRNYRFDTPLIINTLSWGLGMEQLQLLIWIGVLSVCFLVVYFYCATIPERPFAGKPQVIPEVYRSRRARWSAVAAGVSAGILLFFVGREVYRYHNKAALTRIANGVGQENEEGLSPLGFHSALGSTNQPSALVRLEGDYKENPFSPMLYMRETALSQFNGKEIVIASHRFDRDAEQMSPGYEYAREEDSGLFQRKQLTQSMYLLTDHKNAFAIDYPISFKQLKNPNVKRFKTAYQAVSVVPAFSMEELAGKPLGDPRWSAEEVDLYLQQHGDPRYREFAFKVAGTLISPLDKARAVTAWLSKNATYTLTPNHKENENDPVAPFLFGDLRGYCVHFAHSMVYLFRALGIPSRIGTGYLTDMSQAKDGHVLLRMSDRHAWAEIYFGGVGWVPFDVQPENVESHAETQVDAKLLEDLMQMIGPDETVLPSDVLNGEKSDEEMPGPIPLPDRRQVAAAAAAALGIAIILKLYLVFGWLLPASPAGRLKRSYRAVLAWLDDLGFERNEGETRQEFSARVREAPGVNMSGLSSAVSALVYSKEGPLGVGHESVNSAHEQAWKSLGAIPWYRRLIAFFSPSSLIAFLGGSGW